MDVALEPAVLDRSMKRRAAADGGLLFYRRSSPRYSDRVASFGIRTKCLPYLLFKFSCRGVFRRF
jgi:hypothetical protein